MMKNIYYKVLKINEQLRICFCILKNNCLDAIKANPRFRTGSLK